MPVNFSSRITSSLPVTAAPQNKSELIKNKTIFSGELKTVKNSLTKLNTEIVKTKQTLSKNESLLKSLQSIDVHKGHDAAIRLKNDNFKSGQSSNFLKNMIYGKRYQNEREAAAKYVGGSTSEISVSKGSSLLNKKIDGEKRKLDELKASHLQQTHKENELKQELNLLDRGLRNIDAAEKTAQKAGEARKQRINDFSMIYQSNAGCKAINAEARHQYGNAAAPGKLRGTAVVSEYERVHSNSIFAKGNKSLKSHIETCCSDLTRLVKQGAEDWYTPSITNRTTWRGQGMTQQGISALNAQFRQNKAQGKETVFTLGQFFSTSREENVARDFASRSTDDAQVLFHVKGNSGGGLHVSNGLRFTNKENETLYSPLANVKVTSVAKEANGIWRIKLEEVTQRKNAPLLPY